MQAVFLLYLLVGLAVSYVAKMLLVDTPFFDASPPDLGAPGAEESAASDHADAWFTGSASAQYWDAVRALRESEYERALAALEQCAPDDVDCQRLRGEMHMLGAGMPRNMTEAVRLITEVADAGDAESQFLLGVIHANLFEGDPALLRRDEALSVLYLYAASVAGHAGALMAMGYRHAKGYGVPNACSTAALNYIEVARRVADVYSTGMPQAVELVRLGTGDADKHVMSASEMGVFVELAASGDATIATAVGKRYLLGTQGFRQDFAKARQLLLVAAETGGSAAAQGLLGYMYCLGLGVAKDMDSAFQYFEAAAAQNDALGHNGLGYIYFHGTDARKPDKALALTHFNRSAHDGSADGMFNLASLYLTGQAVEQSFHTAVHWYTQALDRGHTPAAYTLAVMHLNGVGTIRDCRIAVDLLKRVCERGEWTSRQLQEAYGHKDSRPESAAWIFMLLAETGHEVSQMNVAHLLDTGAARFLLPGSEQSAAPAQASPETAPHAEAAAADASQADAEPPSPQLARMEEPASALEASSNASAAIPQSEAEERALLRVHAQRHYQMSAEQGNALSNLRLGDYAYYGWGMQADESPFIADDVVDDEAEEDIFFPPDEVRFVPQGADPELAFAHYKRTANMRITGVWMQQFVSRASFNLGFMHHFGIGAERNATTAKHHYNRCFELDPNGVQTPVQLMLWVLGFQIWLDGGVSQGVLALAADFRTGVLALLMAALLALVVLRMTVLRSGDEAARGGR